MENIIQAKSLVTNDSAILLTKVQLEDGTMGIVHDAGAQRKLTAGENISIDPITNVISALGGQSGPEIVVSHGRILRSQSSCYVSYPGVYISSYATEGENRMAQTDVQFLTGRVQFAVDEGSEHNDIECYVVSVKLFESDFADNS